jgi:hypothetical protein
MLRGVCYDLPSNPRVGSDISSSGVGRRRPWLRAPRMASPLMPWACREMICSGVASP